MLIQSNNNNSIGRKTHQYGVTHQCTQQKLINMTSFINVLVKSSPTVHQQPDSMWDKSSDLSARRTIKFWQQTRTQSCSGTRHPVGYSENNRAGVLLVVRQSYELYEKTLCNLNTVGLSRKLCSSKSWNSPDSGRSIFIVGNLSQASWTCSRVVLRKLKITIRCFLYDFPDRNPDCTWLCDPGIRRM